MHRCFATFVWFCTSATVLAQCVPTWMPAAAPGAGVQVQTMVAMPNGDLVVGGTFTAIDGVAANRVARWDGSTWSPLGSGTDGTVYGLAIDANGDLIVGGSFTTAGGTPARTVARWDGTAWSPLGLGPGVVPLRVAVRSNGDVIAMSRSSVWSWDGSSWGPLAGLSGLHLRDMLAMPNGDVVVVGDGYLAGGPAPVARWDGLAWSALGGYSFGESWHALLRRSGELLATDLEVGSSLQVTPIARLTGSGWVALDPALGGRVNAMLELPNGDLIAGGSLTVNGQPLGTLGRWNGVSWTAIDAGVVASVFTMQLRPTGELFVSGLFVPVWGPVPPGLARTSVPCPASVLASGAGCASLAGPVTLRSDDLPWAGAPFRATASGMAAQSLAVHVVGVTAVTVPLPLGAPGCLLLVDPLVTSLLVPVAGTVTATLGLPNLPSLAGVVLHTQVVGLELDAASNLVQTTGTNALLLTVGAL